MSRLVQWLDRVPTQVPEQLKPFLRPLAPFYQYTQHKVYRIAPERVVRTPWGPKIHADPANYVERRLAQGTFEADTVDYFCELVDGQTGLFADIGANIGFFSILYETLSANEGTVDAFEPLESNRKRMSRNIALNESSTVDVYPFGFSDSAGTAELWVSESNPGEASLSKRLNSGPSDYPVEIELRRLDDFYPTSDGLVPDICKIDVEGAEAQVLRGGKDFLAECHPDLLLELHPPLLSEFDDSLEDLISILHKAGYTTACHIEDGREFSVSKLADTVEESAHLHVFGTPA